jgi:hypothetical protein
MAELLCFVKAKYWFVRLFRAVGTVNLRDFAGVIQLVECQLPKLDVVGSSPIARSVTHYHDHLRKRPAGLGRPFFVVPTVTARRDAPVTVERNERYKCFDASGLRIVRRGNVTSTRPAYGAGRLQRAAG